MDADRIRDLMETDLPMEDMAENFSVFRGLEILRKYVPDADIAYAEHDIVYSSVSAEDVASAGITEEDLMVLRMNNWMIDEDGNSFAKFV